MARNSGIGGGAGQAPLSSDVVVNGGVFVPRRSLDRYAITPASGVRHIVACGDSVSQETAVWGATIGAYLDGWVSRLARSMGQALGPLVGIGFQGLWRSGNLLGYLNTAQEWGITGSVIQLGAGNAANLVPFRSGVFITGAAGSTNFITWTPRAAQAPRTVVDAVTRNGSTVVLPASNGVTLSTFVGAGVINVADTTNFDASGWVRVLSTGGALVGICSYTGKTATTLTGVTYLTSSSNFALATGNVVDCTTIVSSATAAFVSTDAGQTIYGTNILRNQHVVRVLDATHFAMNLPATAAGTAGVLGLLGRVAQGPIAEVRVYYMDQAGLAQFSTSIDGGATWQNGPAMTAPASTQLKEYAVACINPADFRIRGANAAGTAASCVIGGIEPRSVANATAGVVVHNLCRDGSVIDAGGGLSATNNGFLQGADAMRLLDNAGVPANTGSLQPSLVIVFSSNDEGLSPATFTANLTTINNRIGGYADMLVILSFEQIRGDVTPAQGATFRAAVHAWCVTNNVAYIDLYDAWAAQGDVGAGPALADGLLNYETAPGVQLLHPSLEGHADIAGHVMRVFSSLGSP